MFNAPFVVIATNGTDSREVFVGIISKLYKMQGIKTINAITRGNKTVQQNDINWSNLIRGKAALAQINIKIITQVLNPIVIPYNNPSIDGSDKKNSLLIPLSVRINQVSKWIYCIKDNNGEKLNI